MGVGQLMQHSVKYESFTESLVLPLALILDKLLFEKVKDKLLMADYFCPILHLSSWTLWIFSISVQIRSLRRSIHFAYCVKEIFGKNERFETFDKSYLGAGINGPSS